MPITSRRVPPTFPDTRSHEERDETASVPTAAVLFRLVQARALRRGTPASCNLDSTRCVQVLVIARPDHPLSPPKQEDLFSVDKLISVDLWVKLVQRVVGTISPMSAVPDTRQRLIDAAVEVIETRGEAALRLGEIAEKAGIKQPSIYHFFPSREDLVVEAYREQYRRAVEQATRNFDEYIAQVETREEFIDAVEEGLLFTFDDQRSEIRAKRLSLLAKALENPGLRAEINDLTYESNKNLAQIFENAQRKGWIRSDVSGMTLAVWVRGQIFGRFLLELDRSRYDGDEWNRQAISSILAGTLTSVDQSRG